MQIKLNKKKSRTLTKIDATFLAISSISLWEVD
jgi:hypothetical protein